MQYKMIAAGAFAALVFAAPVQAQSGPGAGSTLFPTGSVTASGGATGTGAGGGTSSSASVTISAVGSTTGTVSTTN